MEIIKIEAKPKREMPQLTKVGIYCRVSSTHAEQLKSLSGQVSYCFKKVNCMPFCVLEDIYIDIMSGKIANNRPELQRLLSDCRNGGIDLVFVRSMSRLSRDTVDLLEIVRETRRIGVTIIFDAENIRTDTSDAELVMTFIVAFAQADNESRGQNTKMGLEMAAANGTSRNYKRRCFGYFKDENGNLQIDEDEAKIVRHIFGLYLSGESLLGIIRALENEDIKTPNGCEKWGKNTIDKMLSNEKYCGEVMLFKTYDKTESVNGKRVKRRKKNAGQYAQCLLSDANPAIIPKEVFNAVQLEKARRSNMEVVGGEVKRKKTRYSSPKSD